MVYSTIVNLTLSKCINVLLLRSAVPKSLNIKFSSMTALF